METLIQTAKPKIQKIRVVARDTESGKSRTITVYGMTPDQFADAIRSIGDQNAGQPGDRRHST